MTKDLSDVLPDMKAAEEKINAGEAPAKAKEEVKKLEQPMLPGVGVDVIKLPNGKTGVTDGTTKVEVEPEKTEQPEKPKGKYRHDPTLSNADAIVAQLEKFCLVAGNMDVVTVENGEKIVKRYPRQSAWKYLASLTGTHTCVEDTTFYSNFKGNPTEYMVEVVCSLVRDSDGEVLTTVTAAAASDESFVKAKGISAAYGLATTRAESRAVRSVFGEYMACVGLEVTPYEELTDLPTFDLEEA